MKKRAALDIGSQTIRLLIAEVDDDCTYRVLYRAREIVRLGENMQETKKLTSAAMERAVSCITSFTAICHEHGVHDIHAVATACVRNARNKDAFLDLVQSSAGIRPRVISGTDEALLSLSGVRSVINTHHEAALIIDIGGGSTELIFTEKNTIGIKDSIPLGVIALAEDHLKNDPPDNSETSALQNAVRALCTTKVPSLKYVTTVENPVTLIGTAGTVTTLAAMDLQMTEYNPDTINGHILKDYRIVELYQTMISLPLKERTGLAGLEEGRALVIIPGTAIVLYLMNLLNCKEMLVSDAGLLEGTLLDAQSK